MMKLIIILLLTLASTSLGKKFGDNRLYSVDVGLEKVNGHVGYFGDFNSDRYTDLFIISQDKQQVSVYLWEDSSFSFVEEPKATIQIPHIIQNILVADFNSDGKLDVLLQSLSPTATTSSLQLYMGNYTHLTYSMQLPGAALDQVMIVDMNADLKPDLLGTAAIGDDSSQRMFWVNHLLQTDKDNTDEGNFTMEAQASPDALPFLSPSSSGFVDMNGDCFPDLFLTLEEFGVPVYELWLWNQTKFSFHERYTGIKGAGQLTFSDINADGAMDVLFPVCVGTHCGEENSIHVLFNQQRRVCKNVFDSSKCRSPTSLCKADDEFKLPAFDTSKNAENVVIVPSSQFKSRGWFLNDPDFPGITIRTGDFNLDSYPDLLITLTSGNFSWTELWANIHCTGDCRDGWEDQRSFERVESSVQALTDIPHSFAGAWFDIEEAGSSSMIVLSKTPDGIRSIHAVYNNFFTQDYFIKMLGLNGVCTGWCSSGPKFPKPKPYGVNQHGATFKITYSDLGGTQHAVTLGQLHQSANLALLPPYVIAGLNRPSTYVEYLYYAVPFQGKSGYYQKWPGVIPNSQVVTIPHPADKTANWRIELYINPSSITGWVLLATSLSLVLLGSLIGYLHWREKRQDEREKQETKHLFSFKAL